MKTINLLIAICAVFAISACSKKDGGGGSKKATTPGSCYNNNSTYGGYQYQWKILSGNKICVDTKNRDEPTDPQKCYTASQFNTQSGYSNNNYYGYSDFNNYNNYNNYNSNRYYYSGNRCIDSQTGDFVNESICKDTYKNCDGYAPGVQPIYGGYQQGACSIYDTYDVTYYPVTYPVTGVTVCVGYQTINQFNSYWGSFGYNPMYMSSGSIQGCRVGSTSCNCLSAGGTIGWISGGFEFGICAY